MRCPYCSSFDIIVKDSRSTEDNTAIRRRRYCSSCKGKFTTFEKVHIRELTVIKRTGIKKPLDRDKIYKSISTALRKRNATEEQILNISNQIVLELASGNLKEVPTHTIGELILNKLATIDQVAYVRFASFYRDFTNAKDFAKFANKIK